MLSLHTVNTYSEQLPASIISSCDFLKYDVKAAGNSELGESAGVDAVIGVEIE